MTLAIQPHGNGKTLLIAVVIAVIGPVLLSWMNGCQRRSERLEDWDRQDSINEKLDEIHTLVNSQLTRAMKNELEAMIRERSMMTELMDLKKINGLEPTDAVLESLATSADMIIKLRTEISDRERQQAVINEQLGQ